ncbi:MAG: EAL domain-containing protein [Solobacterium sp.]|nr:EAL domain-containing protein [Solobacterium sp.]
MSENENLNEMDPLQKQMLDDVFDAFSMLAEGSFVSLMHVDGGFTRYSKAAVELLDLPGEYIPNGAMDWNDYLHPEDRKRYMDVMMPLLTGETMAYDITYRVRTKSGEYQNFRAVGAVLRGELGKPSLIGGKLVNEGSVKDTDPITVLKNEYAFIRDLEEKLSSQANTIILLLGINHMNQINEMYGYGYGNRVLQQAAWMIQESVRDRGDVYRMPGSKFAIITRGISEAEASAMYDTMHVKLRRGIQVGSNRHNLDSSGGIINTTGAETNAHTIYSALTFAYRESRTTKQGELVSYGGSADSTSSRQLSLLTSVRESILDGCKGFYLEYQPILSLRNNGIIGAEALLRWKSDTFGVITPDEFLSVLERDYIFEELAGWILTTAMNEFKPVLEQSPDTLLGINIAASQIQDEYFIDTILSSLHRTGFPASNLCIELTEGVRLLDLNYIYQVSEKLHARGIKVALDHFGRGYASHEFTKTIHPDIVKFDVDMVHDFMNEPADRAALGSFVNLAAAYCPSVCIKGAETAELVEELKSYPISSIQGNGIAKPMSAQEVITFINDVNKTEN